MGLGESRSVGSDATIKVCNVDSERGRPVKEELKSVISITRVPETFALMRELDIILDDEVKGSMLPGSKAVFHVDPGQHDVYVKMDWFRSAPVSMMLRPGEAVTLFCWSRFVRGRPIYGALVLLFSPHTFFCIGPQPIKSDAKIEGDRERIAGRLALAILPLLMIPALSVLWVLRILMEHLSDVLGFFSAPILLISVVLYVALLVLLTISCHRWLKKRMKEFVGFKGGAGGDEGKR
jgi:hypothetical protein